MDEKIGKNLGKHVISLFSSGISVVVQVRDVKNDSDLLRMTQLSEFKWLT